MEIQEERDRLIHALMLVLGLATLSLLAGIALSAALVVLFWQYSPVVTLLLTPADAQKLELAKNQGKISLSLRNPLDTTRSADSGPITTEK